MDVEKRKCVNRLAEGNEACALFSNVYGRFELQLCRNFSVTANTALVSQEAWFAAWNDQTSLKQGRHATNSGETID